LVVAAEKQEKKKKKKNFENQKNQLTSYGKFLVFFNFFFLSVPNPTFSRNPQLLTRMIFLETVAGVPGMVASVIFFFFFFFFCLVIFRLLMPNFFFYLFDLFFSHFSTRLQRDDAAPALSGPDAARQGLDQHAARRGRKRAHAPAHLPQAQAAGPRLPRRGAHGAGRLLADVRGALLSFHVSVLL
jgi:hypothetical protein